MKEELFCVDDGIKYYIIEINGMEIDDRKNN